MNLLCECKDTVAEYNTNHTWAQGTHLITALFGSQLTIAAVHPQLCWHMTLGIEPESLGSIVGFIRALMYIVCDLMRDLQ